MSYSIVVFVVEQRITWKVEKHASNGGIKPCSIVGERSVGHGIELGGHGQYDKSNQRQKLKHEKGFSCSIFYFFVNYHSSHQTPIFVL